MPRDRIIEGDSDVVGDFARLTDLVFSDDDHSLRPTAAKVAAMLDDAQPQRRRCRLRLFLSTGRARVAAMINPRLCDGEGRPIGLLGFFESIDDEAAAREVLHAGAAWLRAEGATIVRGPVNYTTWNDYRFTIAASEPGWFAGEPYHPAYYPRLWAAAGFGVTSRYGSYWLGDLPPIIERFSSSVARCRAIGHQVRPLQAADLSGIYRLAMTGFAGAYMFSPIEPDEFIAINGERATTGNDTSFVVVAGSEVQGFIYTYVAELPSGPAGIIKTVVVAPGVRGGGTYGALMSAALEAFVARGVSRAIGGLMHADGDPSNMGWCRPEMMFKQYGLYELLT